VAYEAQRGGGTDRRTIPPVRPLWRQRDFAVFWAAQTLSVLGDSFALIALPLLVLEATGSVARMGLLTAVGGAAAVVAAVFAGVVVDRVDRRRLLVGCDLVRMVLYGVIPVVWLLGPQVWLLYGVLPVCEAVGMLFAVGYVTVVRSLVGTGQLTEANGRLNATAAAAGVLGPVCAGAVAAWTGPATAVGVDAVSFGVSALCTVFVRFRARPAGPAERTGLWRDLRTGAAFLRKQPVLRSLTVLLFVFMGATLAWSRVASGLGLALAIVGLRFAAKVAGSVVFARLGGVSWRKGALAGLALAPMSALVIALLVQTRYMGINLVDQLAPLAGATLLLALVGPVLTQLALKWAKELPE